MRFNDVAERQSRVCIAGQSNFNFDSRRRGAVGGGRREYTDTGDIDADAADDSTAPLRPLRSRGRGGVSHHVLNEGHSSHTAAAAAVPATADWVFHHPLAGPASIVLGCVWALSRACYSHTAAAALATQTRDALVAVATVAPVVPAPSTSTSAASRGTGAEGVSAHPQVEQHQQLQHGQQRQRAQPPPVVLRVPPLVAYCGVFPALIAAGEAWAYHAQAADHILSAAYNVSVRCLFT